LSVLTAILAFAPAIAAKVKRNAIIPAPSNEGANLIDRALFDKALRTCAKLLDQRQELEREVEALRAALDLERRMHDETRRGVQHNNLLAAQAQLAQYQAAQQHDPYQHQAVNMQQAQNAFRPSFGDFCNCVPARHDLLLGALHSR
jgi:hypothetical protein